MKHLVLALIATFILASCTMNDITPPDQSERVELYFVAEPCSPAPEWYAFSADEVERTESFLADSGIEASVTFVMRGDAVCLACIVECAGSYLIASVAEADVGSMKALGWTETNPFDGMGEPAPETKLFGSWTLISAQTPMGPIERATLTIDQESIGGQGPCNVYGGSASFSDGTVAFSEIFSTLMYCEDTMDDESAYFAALAVIDSCRFDGDELILSGNGVTLRYAPVVQDAETAVYFVDIPCEEHPEWYPSGARDVSRVVEHLSSQDITADVVFVDRGAVCRACLETCAGSYLIAQVPVDAVDAMLAQGWRIDDPFPDEDRSASQPVAPIEFSYYPVQCEIVPWDGEETIIDEDMIAPHYREQGLTVSNVERLELDLVTCEACYVCPSTIGYTLTLESGDPGVLTRDGWSGGPSCEETGCSEGRTCSDGVCVFETPQGALE